MRRCLIVVACIATAAFGACGNNNDRSKSAPTTATDSRATALDIVVSGIGDAPMQATIECDGAAKGTEWLKDSSSEACRALERAEVRRLLTTAPDPTRICTQIYGGPQRADITGTVAGDPVDRTITRTNGCGIGDWSALQALLPEVPPGSGTGTGLETPR